MILVIFYLPVTPMRPTKFRVMMAFLFYSEEEMKNKFFKDGRHGSCLGFPIKMILVIFDLPVTPILPTKLAFWFRRRREKQIFKLPATAAILDF